MKDAVWISYDLGVKGDYENLYEWLDRHKAEECGDSMAYFTYDHPNQDIAQDMKEDILGCVNINEKKNRIYLIMRVDGKIT